MKQFITSILFMISLGTVYSCTNKEVINPINADLIFVGSTPGGASLKAMLGIPLQDSIDFIRWELLMYEENNFNLNLQYGINQPNTLGFKEGGKSLALKGKYAISNSKTNALKGDVYQLKSGNASVSFKLVKINDNLFHLLDKNDQLMVGNGGWSYTLNRKDAIPDATSILPALTNADAFLNDTAPQRVYDGRTPCQAIAKDYNLAFGEDCFKLKWRLIFNRDPKTLLPTTYQLRNVQHRVKELEGKWSILKGYGNNPNAVIIQLNPDKPDESLSFLVGDENVLFFLDKKKQLFIGDPDFNYTLNRVK